MCGGCFGGIVCTPPPRTHTDPPPQFHPQAKPCRSCQGPGCIQPLSRLGCALPRLTHEYDWGSSPKHFWNSIGPVCTTSFLESFTFLREQVSTLCAPTKPLRYVRRACAMVAGYLFIYFFDLMQNCKVSISYITLYRLGKDI